MSPDPDAHTTRVSNLRPGTDDKLLSNGLKEFGPVSWARVAVVDDEFGQGCPLGFVPFRDASGYERALCYKDPIFVDHHEVRISHERPHERRRDVAVLGQISVGTTEQEIEAAFGEYNPTHMPVVAPEGRQLLAFVRLATEDDRARLLETARDGIEINGEKVVVPFARSLAIFPRMAQNVCRSEPAMFYQRGRHLRRARAESERM